MFWFCLLRQSFTQFCQTYCYEADPFNIKLFTGNKYNLCVRNEESLISDKLDAKLNCIQLNKKIFLLYYYITPHTYVFTFT